MIATTTHEISIQLRAQGGKYILLYIYIYTQPHTHRQARNSIYNEQPLVSSYGEKIATTTHATIYLLASPGRQVHVPLYIYIHTHTQIYIYTHTHTNRPASPSITHGPCMQLRRNECKLPRTRFSIHLRARGGNSILLYIYIHIHTQTQRDEQVHLGRTAPCVQLRRNDCYYHAQDFRINCAPKTSIPCYFIYICI
jgi:hypothetical protein